MRGGSLTALRGEEELLPSEVTRAATLPRNPAPWGLQHYACLRVPCPVCVVLRQPYSSQLVLPPGAALPLLLWDSRGLPLSPHSLAGSQGNPALSVPDLPNTAGAGGGPQPPQDGVSPAGLGGGQPWTRPGVPEMPWSG